MTQKSGIIIKATTILLLNKVVVALLYDKGRNIKRL